MISVRKALASDLPGIEGLLSSAQLPTGDVGRRLSAFHIADDDGEVIGVGGLEDCGSGVGLLRSFAVAPAFRNRGIAARLFERIYADARRSGITEFYLLTNIAQDYFTKRGFAPVAREQAPALLRRASQYAAEPRCSTATLMFHRIDLRDYQYT